MKLSRLGEDELIAAIRREFDGRGGSGEVGIGDDAAAVRFGPGRLLLTKDLLVEDVDFRRSWGEPRLLGRKSLNVSLSDIAAMGGRPLYALLGLAMPKKTERRWVEDFFEGFGRAAREHDVRLVGGDLSDAAKIMISVTVAGRADAPVARRGARPGDHLFVSGTLGDAAGGLRLLSLRGASSGQSGRSRPGYAGRGRDEARLLKAFLDPQPRLELGRELARRRLAAAMIDLSDGLSTDLGRLCRESGVGAEVWADHIPLSPALRKLSPSPLRDALDGGEDFELLFSVRPDRLRSLLRLGGRYPLYPIGRILRGRKMYLIRPGRGRAELRAGGFRHFL